MPKGTVVEDEPYPIPENIPVPVRLDSVELFQHEYTNRQGNPAVFRKWEWNFSVIEGEYSGLTIRGNSEPKITNMTERTGDLHLARPWIEALLGRELQIGEEVDTDDLVGLTAVASVEHLEPRPKKDGGGFWFNVAIDELYPPPRQQAQAAARQDPWAAGTASYDEPPF